MSTTDILDEPALAIAEYSPTAARLADLRARLANVAYDVKTVKGMDIAKKDRAEVRDLRVALEKKRVELKAPALERCRLIDTEAKRITSELLALEEPIDEQIKAEERRKEEEKQARINAEFGRVNAIQEAIADIHMQAMAVVGKPSGVISAKLDEMRSTTLEPMVFQEMLPQAQQAQSSAVAKLEQALKAQLFSEAEAAKVAAEREELAQLRAAQAEQKRREEAAAAAARKAEDARLAAERKAQEAELAAQRAEQKRLDAEAAAARAEADRVAREQREAEQRRIDAERAELRRKQDEADAQARAERLAAEAAEQRIRDAAPTMLAALRELRPMVNGRAAIIVDAAIKEATGS